MEQQQVHLLVIISNSPSANGVPQLLNNAGNNLNASTNPSNLAGTVDNTDGTADIGQGIGDSQDNTINSFVNVIKPHLQINNYPTQHGITAFNRAGADNQNWPMVRQSRMDCFRSKYQRICHQQNASKYFWSKYWRTSRWKQ